MEFEFVKGPIVLDQLLIEFPPSIQSGNYGASSWFIGIVRGDEIDRKIVEAIEYTAYEELAKCQMNEIFSEVTRDFYGQHVKVQHSLGVVPKGSACLAVVVSGRHRKDSIGLCSHIVEEIKKKLPVWGKELFHDNEYQWKVNL
jgi:molybdopterin synthase catalytic subunit